MNKKIVYIDMDDCIADFYKSAKDENGIVDEGKMYVKDFFFNLEPIPGALTNVRRIINLGYDVWILTQPLANSAASYEEKVRWINVWFPELYNKVIMTQNKGLHIGEYLIDDRDDKWKTPFESNGGTFLHFNYVRGSKTQSDHTLRFMWEDMYKILWHHAQLEKDANDPIPF